MSEWRRSSYERGARAKAAGLLHELLPNAALIAVLSRTGDPTLITDLQTAAAATNLAIEIFIARGNREIDELLSRRKRCDHPGPLTARSQTPVAQADRPAD
jgi:hypothetical protein